LAAEIVAVEKALGSDGRVLVRPSGTEPLLRLMVEARDAHTAQRMAQRLADTLTSV
jgi:phosphoglucosamine mutase